MKINNLVIVAFEIHDEIPDKTLKEFFTLDREHDIRNIKEMKEGWR